MSDEDESTDSSIIAVERGILRFLRDREPKEAVDEGAREDRGPSDVSLASRYKENQRVTNPYQSLRVTREQHGGSRCVPHPLTPFRLAVETIYRPRRKTS